MTTNIPDLFLQRDLETFLERSAFYTQLHCFLVCDSTNDIALSLARQGAPCGTVVLSRRQERGRGRQKNVWHTPNGNVALSLVLRRGIRPGNVSKLMLAIPLAIVEWLHSLQIKAHIKWPNDIVVLNESAPCQKGKYGAWQKLCGILAEGIVRDGQIQGCVIGIGLNRSPLEPPMLLEVPHAVSLVGLGIDKTFKTCASDMLEALEQVLIPLAEARTLWPELLIKYRGLCMTIGQEVLVHHDGQEISGKAVGVGSAGELLVQIGEEIIPIWSQATLTESGIRP